MTAGDSDLVGRVRAAVPQASVAKRIRKKGCGSTLEGLNNERVLLDVDKIVEDGREKCDYLYLSNRPLVAAIELKRGRLEASEAVRQLRAGAQLADKLIKPRNLTCELRVVAFCKGINRAERELLRRPQNFVRFRGKTQEIKVVSCGSSLKEFLD